MTRMKESYHHNKYGILLMVVAALLTAFGQLQWKISDADINLWLIGGFVCYFLGAVFMILAYRFGSLSVLHPFLSTGYIFAVVFGSVFLDEILEGKNLLGVVCIIAGAILIGGGDD
ncbi:EamA family transporter [Gracilibacillus caseinilyticus]|uniref:EamA family transporter n=1 Tax=Gracilibacillus caseinilyticus TaxID=2932256 RepID=A0ABY4F278_9BACI|nr:EamA family transporter [Gracilibacillus caseinilyticus]UOQ50277.1 EamA family transporter [Gracilibacillus caseinilyticus]